MGVHHHKSPIVTDGLVFQVDADNNLSGNVSNVKNIVKPTETGSFVNGASVVNGAYDFDGVDDYIDFGNVSSVQIDRTTVFTLDFWIYRTSSGYLQPFTKIKTGDVQNTGFSVSIYSSADASNPDRVQLRMRSSTFDELSAFSNSNVPLSQWANVCVSSDGTGTFSGVEFYIDGVSAGKINSTDALNSGTVINTSPLQLGSYRGAFFSDSSQQSNLKLYNKKLTPIEIQQNYNATKNKYH